jgi:hypothetical protein
MFLYRRVVSLVAIVVGLQLVGAAAQAPVSNELVSELAKTLGSTPAQAEGAAGTLFGMAKSRLSPGDFSKVAAAVPGMDALLKAAPAMGGGTDKLSQITGTAGAVGGLAGAASAFSKLGLKPDMVSKAVPVLTQFVTKSGGASVGNLLAGALK